VEAVKRKEGKKGADSPHTLTLCNDENNDEDVRRVPVSRCDQRAPASVWMSSSRSARKEENQPGCFDRRTVEDIQRARAATAAAKRKPVSREREQVASYLSVPHQTKCKNVRR
jgi:hypothetical protein